MSDLIQRTSKSVSASSSPVGFATTGGGSWPAWDRFLTLDGKNAYHIGNICGTCAFLFERLDGANRTVDVRALTARLEAGVTSLDDKLLDALAVIMPVSAYRVALLRMVPQPVTLGSGADYFAVEQVDNQGGLDSFWGLPHYPKVPYYRPVGRSAIPVVDDAKLFDFIVPMFPETWLKQDRITYYVNALSSGSQPTAIALSVLDVKGPADGGVDHWCVAHYLLDGHHKTAAAARAGLPITIISFIAIDHGISDAAQVDAALGTY